jgi:hypothetical protein
MLDLPDPRQHGEPAAPGGDKATARQLAHKWKPGPSAAHATKQKAPQSGALFCWHGWEVSIPRLWVWNPTFYH